MTDYEKLINAANRIKEIYDRDAHKIHLSKQLLKMYHELSNELLISIFETVLDGLTYPELE